MLQNYLQPRVEEIIENEGLGVVWFQQDGATAHTARISLDILKHMFPGRLVSLRGDLGWPARSPDLSICDFFLWGHLKERVFKSHPNTLPQLREQIIEEVNTIPHDMCEHAVRNFRERLQQCVVANGRHLADIIFRT